jgi:hypothetical protein
MLREQHQSGALVGAVGRQPGRVGGVGAGQAGAGCHRGDARHVGGDIGAIPSLFVTGSEVAEKVGLVADLDCAQSLADQSLRGGSLIGGPGRVSVAERQAQVDLPSSRGGQRAHAGQVGGCHPAVRPGR